jgi:ATP-dependent metalloprotease FtsH
MFTDRGQAIIDLAKDYSFSAGAGELVLSALLGAMSAQSDAGVLLAECIGMSSEKLRDVCPTGIGTAACPGKLPLSDPVRAILVSARDLAAEVPDRHHPGLVDSKHLVCAVRMSSEACTVLDVQPCTREDALLTLAKWSEQEAHSPQLDELTERLRALRTELLTNVFGQDHAVHAFVEGLFNAEVVAGADARRQAPRALFVFAGPPGVGKTLLAERGAAYLERPFKRFDMSSYSGFQQNESLVGMARSFHGAHPGLLTEFVEKNSNAVLLFDEIEKAHLNTIHLFLQILDAGMLEDKYHERNVGFRDTTIIFTTNAGRQLYDRPNASGVISANASFHRRTILDALESEKNPQTGQPFFPAAICSRLATGYPVLFNHLRVNELERVVKAELKRFAGLFERQYYKRITFDALLPMCLVLREGARADARTLGSQAQAFARTEIFSFCQLFKIERIEEVLNQVDELAFTVESDSASVSPEVRSLFDPPSRSRVLLVADPDLTELYQKTVTQVEWRTSSSGADALRVLAEEKVDMVLLDLWIGSKVTSGSLTASKFDHVPAATKKIGMGQELLRQIHDRLPEMPVYLLSLSTTSEEGDIRGSVDEELFMACVRAGGARGTVFTKYIGPEAPGSTAHRDEFGRTLVETGRLLHRERAVTQMSQEHKTLAFDTIPRINQKERRVSILLRNLRLARAIAAADAGEVLDDVERPQIRFDDVIGANTAKDELRFFIDFLKNPKRFAALGLKPPKGVLLYGPPGTGKTMLARAMAGESNVAFMAAAASTFVTMWQGSGPQNVRQLFERARRYAPAIVFIDEIDAIGKVRSGSSGAGHGEEMALNALLTEMDGFTGPSPDRPVFVLAATNFKIRSEDSDSPERSTRTLDPALVRRFSRALLVDLPDTAARRKYLTLRLEPDSKGRISQAVVDLIAEKSVGMSIADLEGIIETAARVALKNNTEISDEILQESIDVAREGEAKQWSPEFLESTARHEAGHTIMYWLSGWWSPEVSIVARGDHGGGMRRSEAEMKRESLTREEMLERIRTSLGGRAAELLYYGPNAGLTTGAAGDLEHATHIARQMICCYGMDEDFGILAVPELFKYAEAVGSPVYQQVAQAAAKILKEQMKQTSHLIEENRVHLDAVAKALQKQNRLYRSDLERLLPASRTL